MARSKGTLAWVRPHALDLSAREELWRFVAGYEDIAFEDFSARLEGLSHALVARHASGRLGGLVAAKILTAHGGSSARTVVWGEWGFLDRPFRGRLLLERAMLRGVLESSLRQPLRPVYFMAEAASWKGYVALIRGFGRVWPRPGHPLPDAERRMVLDILHRHDDPQWDASRGVFHRGKPIRSSAEGAPTSDRQRELRAFYEQVNPGHAGGDSLLVVAPFSWASFVTMPLRTFVLPRLA